jgi:hypothetical protein
MLELVVEQRLHWVIGHSMFSLGFVMSRTSLCIFATTVLLLQGAAPQAFAQLPTGWKAHDLKRPAPPVVTPGESNLPLKAPSDAIILFDGKDLSNWRSKNGGKAKWKVVDGVMESVPKSGYVFSKQKFGDCQLHVEWASPAKVKGKSQQRGNSGVFLMELFEVQVLDCYNNPTYSDGNAGSIYGQYPPLVNASRKPGEWQSYDIVFKRPRFDGDKLVSPATLTVLHNGVLVQNHSKAFGPTAWMVHDEYDPLITEGSLGLQDHGNPVRYRNIWIRPLTDPPRPESKEEYPKEHQLSDEMKNQLVGQYEGFSIEKRGDSLFCLIADRPMEMVAVSETEFVFRKTAGNLVFTETDDGQLDEAYLMLDAAGRKVSKVGKSAVE